MKLSRLVIMVVVVWISGEQNLSAFLWIFSILSNILYGALASLKLKVGGLSSFRNMIILFIMDCYVSIIICLLFGKTLFLFVFLYSLVAGIALKESICFAAGNGVWVYFWSDIWVENQSLRNLFPRLFSLSSKKDCWIADMGDLELTMEERISDWWSRPVWSSYKHTFPGSSFPNIWGELGMNTWIQGFVYCQIF